MASPRPLSHGRPIHVPEAISTELYAQSPEALSDSAPGPSRLLDCAPGRFTLRRACCPMGSVCMGEQCGVAVSGDWQDRMGNHTVVK